MAKATSKKKNTRTSTKPKASRDAHRTSHSDSAAPSIRVRMYRQGLGDCFLLTFGAGASAKHMLIDCGTLGAITTGVSMQSVIDDIVATTGGTVDVLVVTHEHHDHVSGFNTGASKFRKLKVGRVWMAWTENPADPLARSIKKYANDLALAVGAALAGMPARNLGMIESNTSTSPLAAAARDVLEFSGDPDVLGASDFAKTVDQAMKFVRDDLGVRPTFLGPGDPPFELPEVPGFRFYVLGPPRDQAILGDTGEHGSESLYGLQAAGALFAARTRPDAALTPEEKARCENEIPFGVRERIPLQSAAPLHPAYFDYSNAWRGIDTDWLGGAPDMALQLDSLTNNTSLALAIERIADGRVLLFPGDAQQGPWLSWFKQTWTVKDKEGEPARVTMPDLLRRTVFYKVGHHCSHNATAKEQGLEVMERTDELVAFIPVDRAVALKRNPPGSWRMPARPLLRRLLERCQGRVVRSDIGWVADAANASQVDNADVEVELRGVASPTEWLRWRDNQLKCELAGNRAQIDARGSLHIDYTLH